jgi:pyruvate dehydrogenase E2 component (dihydrolipoamide acetyltransferase)
MVAAAVRMRTPSAMFMSRGAASMRRPQVSYKFQEVIQYALLLIYSKHGN